MANRSAVPHRRATHPRRMGRAAVESLGDPLAAAKPPASPAWRTHHRHRSSVTQTDRSASTDSRAPIAKRSPLNDGHRKSRSPAPRLLCPSASVIAPIASREKRPATGTGPRLKGRRQQCGFVNARASPLARPTKLLETKQQQSQPLAAPPALVCDAGVSAYPNDALAARPERAPRRRRCWLPLAE